MPEKDVLDDLFVTEDQTVSREMLRDLIKSFLQFSMDGKIFFLPEFQNLTVENKMLIYLLGKKVLNLKFQQEEKTSPKEIQESTGLSKGNVNPALTSLSSKSLVRNENGRYFVPNVALYMVKDKILKGGKNQ